MEASLVREFLKKEKRVSWIRDEKRGGWKMDSNSVSRSYKGREMGEGKILQGKWKGNLEGMLQACKQL